MFWSGLESFQRPFRVSTRNLMLVSFITKFPSLLSPLIFCILCTLNLRNLPPFPLSSRRVYVPSQVCGSALSLQRHLASVSCVAAGVVISISIHLLGRNFILFSLGFTRLQTLFFVCPVLLETQKISSVE